jgi:N-acetylmuramoyl-L-alanine amidase
VDELQEKKIMKTIIIDPGHGMGNKRKGVFDPGAFAVGFRESDIAMAWANELRAILRANGHRVVRTRIDHVDPAPIGQRAKIARDYGGEIMISFHCNAFNGTAHGTETFYRGKINKDLAAELNLAVVDSLGTHNRGAKTEGQSQHSRLAIMAFQPCFLIEIGFIDHPGDRAKMTDPALRKQACKAIAAVIDGPIN